MIQSLALTVSTLVMAQSPVLDKPFVDSEYLYNGVNRPIYITITSPRTFGPMALVLMDSDGGLLADLVEVTPGDADLVELFPDIWDIRVTSYVQLLKRDEPAGSALVLQPMLSRLVPITVLAPHPTYGGTHTKIVGWRDEFASESANQENEASGKNGATDASEEEPSDAVFPERYFTGFRAYVERDVVLRTTHGDIRFAMRPDQAPNTVWNFLRLCDGGYYREIVFHRIVPLSQKGDPFVIQAGDPTGEGGGGPGYWLPIEFSQLPHDFGVISMARDDNPDTAGSQIFICLSREGTARLDEQYCSFGYAITGADVILSIAEVELADVATGRPVDPPVIRSADLVPAPPRHPEHGRLDTKVTRPQENATTQPRRVPR